MKTPANKLPEISPTKSGKSESSKLVAGEKGAPLLLEGSEPQFKLKNQVELLSASNTSSPVARGPLKRGSY